MNKINEVIEFFNGGEKWGQGDYDIPMFEDDYDEEIEPYEIRHCILGGLAIVTEESHEEISFTHEAVVIANVVKDQYYDRIKVKMDDWHSFLVKHNQSLEDADETTQVIALFNDSVDTTYSDVEKVLEKASVLLDEEV